MKVQDALEKAKKTLKAAGISSYQLDSQLLLCDVLGVEKEWLIAHSNRDISQEDKNNLEKNIERRLNREPVSYIINRIEFYNINLYVDNRVLCPRVETELIVDEVIKKAPENAKLLDMGTGSGAIAIAIAKNRPDIEIIASEISPEALEVAILNAKNILGSNHKIKFIISDIWEKINDKFDVVATNLPYISDDFSTVMNPEVAKEPSVALYGGGIDGLDLYKKFYDKLAIHLRDGSLIYHESDPWQHDTLIEMAKKNNLSLILQDYLILGFENSKR